jgi:Uma2 family endonuclease
VWVVDVNEQSVRVYRDPSQSGYKTSVTVAGQDAVASLALPDVRLAVADLFPR